MISTPLPNHTVGSAARTEPGGNLPKAPQKSSQVSGGKKFIEHLLDNKQHFELRSMRQELKSGRTFQARELLLYQLRVSEFGLKVEMVSKLAEGASSAVRRLQGQ